ncbi:MAG: hypothetical protein QG608_21 [Actinomycetota bacterium]|nr:hypothetical protein [Actinomycetota bacterium]
MITSGHIRATLTDYLDSYPQDRENLAVAWSLLGLAADLTDRSEARGHLTAGAVLVNEDGQVLHVHHRALKRWLLPGGHLEATDPCLRAAALRELTEETGIDRATVTADRTTPIHIDVHPIPANPAKGEPDHQHIDVRFLFRTTADVRHLQREEVTAAAWRAVGTIGDPALRSRVAAAVTRE